ncbi:MAG: hypothetical protein H7A23_11330 [Leptospiraceae bacterium]|nr:hypothetical protein [Leptospiraceae bacterium]MCP5495137.1 hypothetical protein [Leptospiraceae bacterium]
MKRKNTELELKQYQDHLEELVQKRTRKIIYQSEELRKANKTLQEQKKQLEEIVTQLKETQYQLVYSEKFASLGILTAGIAHEMNNPLNFINASIKALKNIFEDTLVVIEECNQIDERNYQQKLKKIEKIKREVDFSQVSETTRELINNVISGVERTSEIIKGLLLFPNLTEEEKTKEDIHKILDTTLLVLRDKHIDSITISKDYGDIPMVSCYQGKINKVFLNILTNAIESITNPKNTNMKKEINIKTSLVTRYFKQFIQIDIGDTGLGIPKEDVPYIFEPFFTKKEVGKGTGLGLFISLEIIKKHKGFIEIGKYNELGSMFSVFIPLNGN